MCLHSSFRILLFKDCSQIRTDYFLTHFWNLVYSEMYRIDRISYFEFCKIIFFQFIIIIFLNAGDVSRNLVKVNMFNQISAHDSAGKGKKLLFWDNNLTLSAREVSLKSLQAGGTGFEPNHTHRPNCSEFSLIHFKPWIFLTWIRVMFD